MFEDVMQKCLTTKYFATLHLVNQKEDLILDKVTNATGRSQKEVI